MTSHNITRLDNASIERFNARRRCWYLTCIRCRNSATRQRSPPSETMINWDELDEFYDQFRHNPALPINVVLTTLSTCQLATFLSMTLQDAQLSPFTLPLQAQASIDNNLQKRRVKQRQRRLPPDTRWCLSHLDTLSMKTFVLHFELIDKQYATARYKTILNDQLDPTTGAALLEQYKQWKATTDYVVFWQDRNRLKTITESHASCSAFVGDLILRVTPRPMAMRVDNDARRKDEQDGSSSNASVTATEDEGLDSNDTTLKCWMIGSTNITELFDAYRQQTCSLPRPCKLETSLQELLAVSNILFLDPNNHSTAMANLLTKLPELPILDQESFRDRAAVHLLRCISSVDEDQTDIRPDAIISTLLQHCHGHPLGFGEVKPGSRSTTKHAAIMDILRLAIICKRSIDKWHRPNFLAIMILGYRIAFFVVSKRHDMYTMLEIASLNVAVSISDLHTFATRKNLDLLSAVSHCFWETCATP
ncbi:hypothetical protein DM01DRAFT_1407811 [Hesseltinella vesiculosa]|uniref:Uncharacterized protein n=1 Tax=Hesseltinella vesiculosa TaxID=101127 RepID=A0A1X2GHD0_9FUNG|nr:hypothetical protein DM01DRAFT_1407811 [Hesseltinella vesiculosa]